MEAGALSWLADDRDAGVVEMPRGSILVTTFTSLAYEKDFEKARRIPPGQPGGWDEVKLREWTAVHERLTDPQRQAELGCWMLRSTDGGVTVDLGDPSTAECDDGLLVTVWYETLPDSPLAQLRQVRWRLS